MSETNWIDAAGAFMPQQLFWTVDRGGQGARIKLEVDLGLTGITQQQCSWLLREMWDNVWAPLLPMSVLCLSWGAVSLKLTGLNFAELPEEKRGKLIATSSDRNNAAVILAWAGGSSPGNTRRFYIPFIPTSYHAAGVLTDHAQEQILTRLRGLFVGCDLARGGIGPRLIVWRRPRPSDVWDVARPAVFADVEQLVLCSFTDKAPVL